MTNKLTIKDQIEEIDKTIKLLEETKKNLELLDDYMAQVNLWQMMNTPVSRTINIQDLTQSTTTYSFATTK